MNESDGDMRKLATILKQELKSGCLNRTVVGGIDRLKPLGESEFAHLKKLPPLKNGCYAELTSNQRGAWLRQVLAVLENGGLESVSNPTEPRTIGGDTPLADLGFIFQRTRDTLAKLGVTTVKQLLLHIPRSYDDYSATKSITAARMGDEVTVKGKVIQTVATRIGAAGMSSKIVVDDGAGKLEAIWFGRADLARRFSVGDGLRLSGKIVVSRGAKKMHNPQYELERTVAKRGSGTHVSGLVPVYPATARLTQRMLRTAVRQLLERCELRTLEWLPPQIIKQSNLTPITTALKHVHFPADLACAEAARQRFAFDELLRFQLGIKLFRAKQEREQCAIPIKCNLSTLEWYNAQLGFELTADQRKTLRSVFTDIHSTKPMFRLIQGEVGAGKTVVALGALLACAASGLKAVLLVPTEILAEQHFINACAIFGAKTGRGLPQAVAEFSAPGIAKPVVRIGLVTGRQRATVRRRIDELIADDELSVLIGTHALLQADFVVPNLGLAVVDEQHRFGVRQRALLGEYKPTPHLLAMSATPIPRTLQMTIYGDMSVSTMRQVPYPRRVKTELCLDAARRRWAYQLCRQAVRSGKQAFIVCPFIDPSDEIPARAATVEVERLKNGVFADLRIGLLHGRMSLKDKQQATRQMRAGELDILVATPMVEVGIDIPNATVMLIESAERFGLAQLHQLRGRVGRAGDESVCCLLSDQLAAGASRRLTTLEGHSDGFYLAEADLKIRGPGDYIGTRQSGWDATLVATASDTHLLEKAQTIASHMLADDPGLRNSPLVTNEMRAFWSGRMPQTA